MRCGLFSVVLYLSTVVRNFFFYWKMFFNFFSFDKRKGILESKSHWQDDVIFKGRAYFTIMSMPTGLALQNVEEKDAGYYRCRVDFNHSPTKNQKLHLNVIGKNWLYFIHLILSNWRSPRQSIYCLQTVWLKTVSTCARAINSKIENMYSAMGSILSQRWVNRGNEIWHFSADRKAEFLMFSSKPP